MRHLCIAEGFVQKGYFSVKPAPRPSAQHVGFNTFSLPYYYKSPHIDMLMFSRYHVHQNADYAQLHAPSQPGPPSDIAGPNYILCFTELVIII